MKVTVIAPSNIAFIKYWGRKDEALRIPENGSISMNLSNLLTTTTVEFNPVLQEDLITLLEKSPLSSRLPRLRSGQAAWRDLSQQPIGFREIPPRLGRTIDLARNDTKRVIEHLDRVRSLANFKYKAKVVSENNFPTSTGLSSSASGFAALTLAASKAAGLNLSEKELSILARQGSGSACRSIPDGFVEWLDGKASETSYAVSLYPPDHWDIVDVVVIVSKNRKEISTTEGQRLSKSSPFFSLRLSRIKEKIDLVKRYLKAKNFTLFGELIEAEALELHAIMLTSNPPLIYWLPATISVMQAVQKWRKEGLEVYFTVNTGQDIHLICQKKDVEKVVAKAEEIPDVERTIINYPRKGAQLIEENYHLF